MSGLLLPQSLRKSTPEQGRNLCTRQTTSTRDTWLMIMGVLILASKQKYTIKTFLSLYMPQAILRICHWVHNYLLPTTNGVVLTVLFCFFVSVFFFFSVFQVTLGDLSTLSAHSAYLNGGNWRRRLDIFITHTSQYTAQGMGCQGLCV